MALKDTIKKLEHLLSALSKDLHKAVKGNKAASQRVRTGTIKLEKTAKKYRKESVAYEKKCCKKKKPAKKVAKKKAPVKKKAAPKKKVKKTKKRK
jgi:hypothetical protein